MRAIWRYWLIGGLALALAVLPGLPGAPLGAPGASEAAAAPVASELGQGLTRLRLGILNSSSDAGFLIAKDQGYFREVGLEMDETVFDSAARMVAPLGAGQLDVGGGAHSAGLNNALARGVVIKLVADKGSVPPGFGFQALMFRRDLAESGRLRSPGDLRGMRIALSARGTTIDLMMARFLQPYGLTLDDVERVELGFPDHVSALGGRTVDASMTIEPFITRIVDDGYASVYQRTDELMPNHLIAEVMYSNDFVRNQADAGRRFMLAYLRAVRDYNDAYVRGDQAKRQMVIASMIRHTAVKDPALYDRMVMPGLHPDGLMNVASLAEDQELWLTQGLQQTRVNTNDLVDMSFAQAAVAALGPY